MKTDITSTRHVSRPNLSVSIFLGSWRDYFCVWLVFALNSINTFVPFSTHLTKKSWFLLRLWSFKENLRNLALLESKIYQLTRSDKKYNARKLEKSKIQKTEIDRDYFSLGTCLHSTEDSPTRKIIDTFIFCLISNRVWPANGHPRMRGPPRSRRTGKKRVWVEKAKFTIAKSTIDSVWNWNVSILEQH